MTKLEKARRRAAQERSAMLAQACREQVHVHVVNMTLADFEWLVERPELAEILDDLDAYLDNRADVDEPEPGHKVANEAKRLLDRLREARA